MTSNSFDNDVVVIYHKNCLDGIAAAWCAWTHYKGKVDLVPVQYKDDFVKLFGLDFHQLFRKTVYCLDFSFDKDTVDHLMGICNPLILLDHHDSAQRALGSLPIISNSIGDKNKQYFDCANFEGCVVVDQTRSGAMLAWEWFNPRVPVEQIPAGIFYVQDRDLWTWKLGDTKAWTSAAFSYEFTVENFDKLINTPVTEVVREGKGIERHMNKVVKDLSKRPRRMNLCGYNVPIVNCNSVFASDLGHLLGQDELFSVTYHDVSDKRIFQLRSSNKNVKVNVLAEVFGGGGHPGAASFAISFNDPQFYHSHEYLAGITTPENTITHLVR